MAGFAPGVLTGTLGVPFHRERQTIAEQRLRTRPERDTITGETIADVEAYCQQVRARLATFIIEE
jgi:hypothetical protein